MEEKEQRISPITKTFRLAHVSDFHFRDHIPGTSSVPQRKSRNIRTILENVLVQIKESQVRFIAITGDLLDVPFNNTSVTGQQPYSRHQMEGAIFKDYELLKKMLDGSGLPYLAVPGNHDDYPIFHKVFGDGPWERKIEDIQIFGFPDREWEGHHPRRLSEERKRWESSLSKTDNLVQVHLQHFLVTPEKNKTYPYSYLEAREMLERQILSNQKALVLQGHYHPGSDTTQHGNAFYSTCPSFCESPHLWRLHTLVCQETTWYCTSRDMGVDVLGKKKVGEFVENATTPSLHPLAWSAKRLMEFLPSTYRTRKKCSGAASF